ncbi:tetratricopeptide repeat protein [Actinoplanes sp. NPDC048988]|uniref:tetratricopeptide repeat protein n=1 Tax=Actinoplanes sp. NPDC048988 TaxID=3363901 RepID=UPI00371D7C13
MIGKLLMDDHEATEGLTALELPDDVNEKVTALSREGDALAKAGRYAEAKQAYLQALPLLPDNPNQWTAAAWLYVAIGDASFHHGLYDEAFDAFFQAVQCPGGLGNPFIHLRLGQLYYEKGNLDKAADELTRAYMGAGFDIFCEDDSKYVDFLETRIQL